MSHYLPKFCEYQGGLWRAVCGAWIAPQDFSKEPTCDHCQLWLTAEASPNVIARIEPRTAYGELR